MEVDPIGFIEAESFIPPSQLTTLSTTAFARHLDFYSAVDDHPWPESSDDDDGVTLPQDDFVTITICSAPSSPDLHAAEDGGAVAAEGDDTKGDENEVELGVSEELGFCRGRKRVREESASPLTKTADDVEDGMIGDRNDVELGNSDGNVCDIVVEDAEETRYEDDELGSYAPTVKKKKKKKTEFIVQDDNGGKNVDECDVVLEGSDLKSGGKSKEGSRGGEVMKCLIQVFRILEERQAKLKEEGDDDDDVDFLETAKRCGYVFPKPRYLG